MCRRAFLESETGAEIEDRQAERFDLTAWLQHEGLTGVVSPVEWQTLRSPIGQLPPDVAVIASWQSEALVALGWALGLSETMPPYQTAASPGPLLQIVPSPWEETRGWMNHARLRDETTIVMERERAELWDWRGQTNEVNAEIQDVATEGHSAGLLPAPVTGDFAVDGSPYRDLPPADRETAAMVAEQRLRALNWLCGYGDSWDDVPLDV